MQVLYVSDATIVCNNRVFIGDRLTIVGSNNRIKGTNVSVHGSNNKIFGTCIFVYGSNNQLFDSVDFQSSKNQPTVSLSYYSTAPPSSRRAQAMADLAQVASVERDALERDEA